MTREKASRRQTIKMLSSSSELAFFYKVMYNKQ